MTDELAFLDGTATTEPTHTGAKGRTCRRHRWVWDASVPMLHSCARCGKPQDIIATRQGKRNRRHGNDMERAVATALGGKRVGHLGGPVDVETPLHDFQIKTRAPGSFPYWMVDEVLKIPRKATKKRALLVFDNPGPGKKRVGLYVEIFDEFAEEQ